MGHLRVATFNILHGASLDRDGASLDGDRPFLDGYPANLDGYARDAASTADGAVAKLAPRLHTDPALLEDAVRTLDADILALQEVDRGQDRSDHVDQTTVAAKAAGANWACFVPTVHGTPDLTRSWRPATEPPILVKGLDNGLVNGGSEEFESSFDGDSTVSPTYGIALLSRYPVRACFLRRFPASRARLPLLVPGVSRPAVRWVPDEPRAAVAAIVDAPGQPVTVIATHLSFVPGVNVRQLRAIDAWARTFPGPRLVIGDLNMPAAVPARLTGLTPLVTEATYPSYRPRIQFDHVLAAGGGDVVVHEARAWRLPVSDHRALSVTLEA